MANNNLEKYLEAILDKIADGTETDIPRPSWNIEKYLAAIYEALSSGGGGGGGGSGGGVLAVSILHDDVQSNDYLDKTYSEIAGATLAVVKRTSDGETIVRFIPSYEEYDGEYYVYLSGDEMYKSDSVDGRLYYDGGSQ